MPSKESATIDVRVKVKGDRWMAVGGYASYVLPARLGRSFLRWCCSRYRVIVIAGDRVIAEEGSQAWWDGDELMVRIGNGTDPVKVGEDA